MPFLGLSVGEETNEVGLYGGRHVWLGPQCQSQATSQQSVRILEKFYPPDDWLSLRPLPILADVWLESGKTARAIEAVKRIQSIQIARPENIAIVIRQ